MVCSICKLEGHNKRTCPSQTKTDTGAVAPPAAEPVAEVAKPVKEKKVKTKKEEKYMFRYGVLDDVEVYDIVKTFKYSDMKNMANFMELYSVW